MRTILTGIFAVVLLAALTGIGLTIGGDAPAVAPGANLGLGLGPEVIGELNLTAAQVTQLQTIHTQYLTDITADQDKLKAEYAELGMMWVAPQPDKAAITTEIADIDALHKQIRDRMVERTYAVMGVLTDQQRSQLRTLVANQPGFGIGLGYDLATGANPGSGLAAVDMGVTPDAPNGQALFTQYCVVCHGQDGKKIAGWKGRVQKMTHAQLEQVIRDGKDGMPAFGKKLTDPQIDAVATYSTQLAAK